MQVWELGGRRQRLQAPEGAAVSPEAQSWSAAQPPSPTARRLPEASSFRGLGPKSCSEWGPRAPGPTVLNVRVRVECVRPCELGGGPAGGLALGFLRSHPCCFRHPGLQPRACGRTYTHRYACTHTRAHAETCAYIHTDTQAHSHFSQCQGDHVTSLQAPGYLYSAPGSRDGGRDPAICLLTPWKWPSCQLFLLAPGCAFLVTEQMCSGGGWSLGGKDGGQGCGHGQAKGAGGPGCNPGTTQGCNREATLPSHWPAELQPVPGSTS